jgi:hypothetical protein
MPDDNTSTADESQNKDANAGGQTADDSKTGADTQTAQSTTEGKQQSQQKSQQQTKVDDDPAEDKQFSQDQVNKIVQKRIDKAVRQALIKRGIDPDDKDTGKDAKPTVETVAKERDDLATRLRIAEARDQLESFIADKRNSLTVSNVRGLFKYIKDDLEFDDEGKVTNFKDVLAVAKSEAGEFFRPVGVGSADGGKGGNGVVGADMNSIIRAAAGRQ